MSVIKQERAINHDNIDPILCGGVKEIIEDERRGSLTPQDSLMEQPGTSTALHSFHKECLETICKVQLRRLDIFQCEVCDAVYIDAGKLCQHIQQVHGPRQQSTLRQHVKRAQISNSGQQHATGSHSVLYRCSQCLKTYNCKRSLRVHYRVVHGKESYKCTKCGKGFKGKAKLRDHVYRVHNDKRYECDVCNTILKSKGVLKGHIARRHSHKPIVTSPVVHTCDYCHKTYTSKSGLGYHIDVVHTKVHYLCSKCNKEYKGKHLLQRHMKNVHYQEEHEGSHSKLYRCSECPKTMNSKRSLTAHSTEVHGKKSLKCTKCDKEFKCNAYLRSHVRNVHSDQQRSRPCRYCQKTFTSNSCMRNHIANLHKGGSYKCHQCNKIFKCKAYLMVHKTKKHNGNVHTAKVHNAGLRTQIHTCDYCQKRFRSMSTLQRHTANMHVAAHIHRCQRCNMNFKSSDKLQQHNTSIHGKTQHKCEVCLRIYTTKFSLGQHVKNTHNSKDIQFKSDFCRREMLDSRPTADDMDVVASTSKQQHNVVVVKEEPADGELELGPVVFQHMDCNYRPYEEEPQDGSGD